MSELEHWDSRYRTNDLPWDTGHPSTELQRVLADEKITPCRAVDLGCGTGTNAVWLAQQGFEVTGIDFSPLAIEQGRKRAAEAGVAARFLVADLLDPAAELGGPYDFCFDRGCYHVVRRIDAARFVDTLRRITHAGSRALVLAGNAREKMDPGPPVVTEEEIRRELGALFEIAWLREIRFDAVKGGEARPLGWSCFLRRPA